MVRNEHKPVSLHGDVARYLTVGAVSAVTDMCTYALLVKVVGLRPLMANLISRPMGGLVSFSLNKVWTFKGRSRHGTRTQLFRYCIVWGISFGVSETLVGLLHDGLNFGPILAKIGAEGSAGLFSFLLQRHWTFR